MTDLLEWAKDYLERDEDIVVPVKKMWLDWQAAGGTTPFDEFTAAVLAEEQFEEMPGVDHNEGMDWMSPGELAEHEAEMEAVGFFSGPRLKLRSRDISIEHIAKMIKKHNDRMEDSLRQAREMIPEDSNEQDEEAVLQVMGMLKELRDQLREAGLELEDDEESKE